MNRLITIVTGLSLMAGVLSGCGGNDEPASSLASGSTGSTGTTSSAPTSAPSSAPSSAPMAQVLTTSSLLTLAQTSSETAAPFQVNNGLLSFTDTSDASVPFAIDK